MKKIIYFLLTHFPNLGIIRFLVTIKWPKNLVQFCLKFYFVKQLKVNLDEAEKTLSEYSSFLNFFTRRLKADARKIDTNDNSIISPVDARILEHGDIKAGTLIQAKGRRYTIKELVGSRLGKEYLDGQFITLYLSPRDYHRIHHPVSGAIDEILYFPGHLYPVNPFSLNNFDRVFSRNKRIVVPYKINQDKKKNLSLISCWVGALNVGGLDVLLDSEFYSTHQPHYDNDTRQKYTQKKYKSSDLKIKKGAEAGCFELGSTVILILPSSKHVKLTFKQDFIYLGEKIAQIL